MMKMHITTQTPLPIKDQTLISTAKKGLIAFGLVLFSVTTFALPNANYANSESPETAADASQHLVNIEWVEPSKYRDVRNPNMSRKRFREQVFGQLQTFFDELAQTLPDGSSLSLTVTNVDLAGTVQVPSQAGIMGASSFDRGFNEMRIMRDVDIPRLYFTYTLKDANGETIKSEEVELKDMNYLRNASIQRRNESLKYEKHMIEKWFNTTFINQP
jgi:hypothetical protein